MACLSAICAPVSRIRDWYVIERDRHWHHGDSDAELILDGCHTYIYPRPDSPYTIYHRISPFDLKQGYRMIAEWWSEVWQQPREWDDLLQPCPYYHNRGLIK